MVLKIVYFINLIDFIKIKNKKIIKINQNLKKKKTNRKLLIIK